MVDPIEPVTFKKRKKVYNPFLVVPYPLPPLQLPGVSVVYAVAGALLGSATRVVEVSNENFHWQKEKHNKGKRDENLRARIRGAHKKRVNKNLSDQRVAIIQRP